MKGLRIIKITLLIVILAEEIKKVKEQKHVYGDSTGRTYTKSDNSPSMLMPIPKINRANSLLNTYELTNK